MNVRLFSVFQNSNFAKTSISKTEFEPEYLYPSPEARDAISFGLDDYRPALADALPPNGQEVRPSAAYSELVDVLSRATKKLSID